MNTPNLTPSQADAHTASFKRFCAQPIGRAKLYLLDYAQGRDALTTRRMIDYLSIASELSIRTFASLVESTQPNGADFEYLVDIKYNLSNAVK